MRYTYVCEPVYSYCEDGCCCHFVKDSFILKSKDAVIAEFDNKESMLMKIIEISNIKLLEEN